jgi:sugar lactone lactonase YvrE
VYRPSRKEAVLEGEDRVTRFRAVPRRTDAAVLGLIAAAASALLLAGASAAGEVAAPPSAPIRQAQVLDLEEIGVPAPNGLAFTPGSDSFYVLDAAARAAPDVVRLTPFVRAGSMRAGSTHLTAAVKDPINMTFDARRNRLLLLLGASDQMLEVRAQANGDLDSGHVVHHDLRRLNLQDPQGMAVDPVSGDLYLLDAAGPRIVRVSPDPDGGFAQGPVSALDLSQSGIAGTRGLAFDPASRHLYLRGGSTLYELSEAGQTLSVRDLAGLELVRPEGMVVAPSGDRTDDPAALSLYMADAGGGATQSSGQIVEASLTALPQAAAANFTSSLVNTVDMARWNPPSPDPSGIAYIASRNRLVMCDGEVEETVSGITHFQGANVWEFTLGGSVTRTANISKVAPTFVPMTNEPTGMAFNPTNGHYYVTDDNMKEVFDLNPGGDGWIGTSDDSWTSFDTQGVGNTDTEGVAYNSQTGRIFVADGVNAEVYEYTSTGVFVGHFDVARYGVADPESVEVTATGTLLTLSNRQSGPIIVETTTSGALLQTIDLTAAFQSAGGRKPAGLALAPASNGSGAKRFYVVDRGIDNNSDPRIVDGKIYEFTSPFGSSGNQPPSVNAGPDRAIVLPNPATLDGTVADDGLPSPPSLTTTWSRTSGPGTVTFGNPSAVDTTASFSTAGTYVLRLTASDGALSSFDELTVTVNQAGSNDLIFADGFESGTLAAWSIATTGGGDLSVSAAAALVGTRGMQAVINDNTAIYVTDISPTAESRYRVRFYFDPNSIPMAQGDTHLTFDGRNAANTTLLRVQFRWNGSQYLVRAGLISDGTSFTSTPWLAIADARHAIELDWRASTVAGANNGGLTLWIDGSQLANLTGVDNDTRRIDTARLGAVSGIDNGTRGTTYFDAFESRRLNYIGP